MSQNPKLKDNHGPIRAATKVYEVSNGDKMSVNPYVIPYAIVFENQPV